ncbi:MAG: hypothetical protein JW919_03985 [Candidatus Omnitrophica bacterium]|nr:hypothetical protein [Candidatus Omnitrophota bacterium]
MKNPVLFKIICILLVAAFLSSGITWAQPSGRIPANIHSLAAQSSFHQETPTDGNNLTKPGFSDEAHLAEITISIADLLFRDNKPLKRLESVILNMYAGSPSADIYLSRVNAFSLEGGDYRILSTESPLPANCIVVAPYRDRSGKERFIHIANRNNPLCGRLDGVDWPISQRYAVKISDRMLSGISVAENDETPGVLASSKGVAATEVGKSALVIGAGKIGRGLVGRMLNDSGYKITFVNRSQGMVDSINTKRGADCGYNLEIVGEDGKTRDRVFVKANAVALSDTASINEAMLTMDTVFVTVYDRDFADVARLIAGGIETRFGNDIDGPLNVIMVSNRFSTRDLMRDEILKNISPGLRTKAEAVLGVVDTVTHVIIPDVPEEDRKADPTLIRVYGNADLVADAAGFRGDIPEINDMSATYHINIEKMRKLFIMNGAHAICAYMGYMMKYRFIQEAAKDITINAAIDAAFEAMRGLLDDWPDYDAFIRSVKESLADNRFSDDIRRVAKDPRRKLANFDRLVSAAKLALKNKRNVSGYVSGIAAAILYDNPADEEAQEIQEMLAHDGGIDMVLAEILGLSENEDAVLISMIKKELLEIRQKMAKAELARLMQTDQAHESDRDKTVLVSDRIPKKVKLVVWDFDDVIGDTKKFYAQATGVVYWQILTGRKDPDARPANDDPLYKEGLRKYHELLPGKAAWLTICAAMQAAQGPGAPIDQQAIEDLAEEYYKRYEKIREDLLAEVEPSEFFNPRMRELLCIMKALNPDIEFCVNTALEEKFFMRQFQKPGFGAYFSSAKALTEAERNDRGTTMSKAKAKNLRALIAERKLNPEEVVVIDDSVSVMEALNGESDLRRTFRIGVAADPGSGAELIDRGVDAVFMNMKPTPEKLRMLGLDSDTTGAVQNIAPDVYLIRSRGEKENVGAMDHELEFRYRGERRLPPVKNEAMRRAVEQAFEALVQRGEIKPNVVVNIKDFSPHAVSVYMKELKKISEYYNGNVTFILVVEKDIKQFRHDMPSVFSALGRAREALGGSLGNDCTIMIADGGRKLRNMPLTLAYLYEGLMPYSGDTKTTKARSRIHEVFVRTGGLLMQMPVMGAGYVPIVASDSVYNSERIRTVSGQPLDTLNAGFSVIVPQIAINPDKEKCSSKIVRAADSKGDTRFVLAKPEDKLLKRYIERYQSTSAAYYGLHFLTLWNKVFLEELIRTMQAVPMKDGRPMLGMPCDMFMLFFQSVSMPEREWLEAKPEKVDADDWKKAREIALSFFKRNLERVGFMKMGATNAFTDEGVLSMSLPRFRQIIQEGRNIVRKSPAVELANASAASLDRVVILGNGRITFGKNVKLSNVIIVLNGTLNIPDGWTIMDSYLDTYSKFEGSDGYLLNVARRNRLGLILPMEGEFKGENVYTVVKTFGGEEILVGVPKNAKKAELEALRFGDNGLSLMDLQTDADIQANIGRNAHLEEIISDSIANMHGIFPLSKDAIDESQSKKGILYRAVSEALVLEIISESRRIKMPYWVTLEGIQGAGKTGLLDHLKGDLEEMGVKVQVIDEDWFHLSREERTRQMKMIAQMDTKKGIYHYESWHYWDRLREVVERINGEGDNPVRIELDGLYDRNNEGRLTRREALDITPGTVIIYTGFYVSDKGKADIRPDLSVYIGIDQEDSLSVKLGRDVWRDQSDVYDLDEQVYRPAFERYIATYDPASSADYVLRVEDIRRREKISVVVPKNRVFVYTGEGAQARFLKANNIENMREERSRVLGLFRTVYCSPPNNNTSRVIEAWQRVLEYFSNDASGFTDEGTKQRLRACHMSRYYQPLEEAREKTIKWMKGLGEEDPFVPPEKAQVNMPDVELKERLDEALKILGQLNIFELPDKVRKDTDFIRRNSEFIEPDSVISAFISLGWRRPDDLLRLLRLQGYKTHHGTGKKAIVAIETDWVHNLDDATSMEKNIFGPLLSNIKSMQDYLQYKGCDEVEVVYAGAGELADDIMKRIGGNKEDADFSNVLVLASKKTLASESFAAIVGAKGDRKPYIAEVDTAGLDRWYGENNVSTELPDIRILSMLDIALDFFAGRQLPDVSIVKRCDRKNRIITLEPAAAPVNVEKLREKYLLQNAIFQEMV